MKTGRLSKKDWDFIEFNADKMSAADIAKELDRALEPIQKHLQKIGKGKTKEEHNDPSRVRFEEASLLAGATGSILGV